MVCECNVASMFQVGYPGIISASITGSAEFIEILNSCQTGVDIIPTVRKKLMGPSLGTINISAYAFAQTDVDRFLGTACPSQASLDIPFQQRFDCEHNTTHIIRTKTGQASREGDPITGITLSGDICSFRTLSASAQSGPNTRVTDTIKYIGTDLAWAGPPFPIDSQNVDSLTIILFGITAYLTNFSISISTPSVATNSYTFQYTIDSCSGANIPLP